MKSENKTSKLVQNRLNLLHTQAMNAITSRLDYMAKWADSRRDIDAECGYEDYITPELYRATYDREGIGTRVVSLYPDECWAYDPELYEQEDAGITTFEKAWNDLLVQRNVWHYLHRIDEMSGIGRFGILLLGIDDGKTLDKPIRNGNEEMDKPSKYGRKLLYMRCFDEVLVRPSKWDNNPSSPRFGMPILYNVTFADTRNGGDLAGQSTTQQVVHWQRIIHVADNRKSSEVYGTPRMQTVFNRLCDLRKIMGGSGEMFWKGAFPGISFETPPNSQTADVELDTDSLKTQIEAYSNGLQRYLALVGVQAKSLAPQVADPTVHMNAQLQAIAIAMSVPVRTLMGGEHGQLDDKGDKKTANSRFKRRQSKYVSPMLIRPFTNRLVWLGVLPPVGSYTIAWPDLDAPADLDKANTSLIQTQAMAQYVGAGVEAICPPLEYYTQVLGWSMDKAQAVLSAAESATEMMTEDFLDGKVGQDPANAVAP